MKNWRAIWRDINTPSSKTEDPYTFAIIALSHAMLGAALGAVLSPFVPSPLFVAPAYFAIKEVRDIKKGGSLGT